MKNRENYILHQHLDQTGKTPRDASYRIERPLFGQSLATVGHILSCYIRFD